MSECAYQSCERAVVTRGHCHAHYMVEYKAGRMHKRTPTEKALTRFWAKVDKTESCWLWRGALNVAGYGSIGVECTAFYAHRWSYMTFVGPIPDGLVIDHLCSVRNCVNPAHLEAVTIRVNVLRSTSPAALAARQTHCKNGHEFNAENTAMTPKGARGCRICRREYLRMRRAS